MRHRRRSRRLGRTTPHRQAMMRNMVASLFQHGRIITTDTRAKELRRLADKMVTLAKDGSLHARRQALSVIRDRDIVAKLFEELKQKFVSRNGGYIRIIKIGPRRGDAALMSYVELVTESLERPKKKKSKEAKAAAAATAAGVIPQAKDVVEGSSDEEQASSEESIEKEVSEDVAEGEDAAVETTDEASNSDAEAETAESEEEQSQPETAEEASSETDAQEAASEEKEDSAQGEEQASQESDEAEKASESEEDKAKE